jgi:hypothetical protein
MSAASNADKVSSFVHRLHNRPRGAGHEVQRSIRTAQAEQTWDLLTELHADGAWRDYTFANGGHGEWLEHEFDYFLASERFDPADLARLILDARLIDQWAELVRWGTQPNGGHGDTRRTIDKVSDQIRRLSTPTSGLGDPEAWVVAAQRGFEPDAHRRAIVRDKRKIARAKKAGSVNAVARADRGRVQIEYKLNGRPESELAADAVLRWLERHPDIATLVRKGLE